MKVTGIASPLKIKEIDHRPAVYIYEKYLYIKNDENFFYNALEFPIFINRNGNMLTRIPVACDDDGSLLLVADVREGDTIQLTNVYNRRKTSEYIDNAIAYADGTRVPALIMADIDYFKEVNDKYGHDVGDMVLKEFTNILKQYSDKGVVGRWGGEEFMIIFIESENLSLVELCENIRRNVEMYTFTNNAKITASFGIVRFNPGYSRAEFCKSVDECLYKAKSSGRNRICTVDDL